jgi:asparagine synthase (glutamine-hydrolysing)
MVYCDSSGVTRSLTTPANLLIALRESIASAIGEARSVAVAYSGGLDSSIVAKLAKEFTEVRCYTCAISGSFDANNAPGFAVEDGLDLTMILLERESLGELVARTGMLLNSEDPVRIAYTIPVICVLQSCPETTILVGSGADELFGGYAKYATSNDPTAIMRSDLSKMLVEDSALRMVAKVLDKRLESPFVSQAVLAFSKSIPMNLKISGNDRKILLRKAAATLGLPSHDRPKKAAQYSSGLLKEMKRQARSSQSSLHDWVRQQTWHEGYGSIMPGQSP